MTRARRLAVLAAVAAAAAVAAETAVADATVAVRNPFARPARPVTVVADAAASDAPAAAPFVLRATLVAGGQSLVNVDGRIVRVGTEIDGFRLVAVNEGTAVFVKNGVRHEFEIRRGPDGDTPAETSAATETQAPAATAAPAGNEGDNQP